MARPNDWPSIHRIMESRYYIDWHHDARDIIRVVRHIPTVDVVGVVTVKPYDDGYLVDSFEVEWENGKASMRGKWATFLIEGFLHNFQKAAQRKLFCLVRLDNGRHERIIKKRGWKHVANLLEYNGQN